MLEHLRPQYAKEFRCIGSACEDVCCHGLDVTIDKETYEKYQAIPRLQHLLEHIAVNTGSRTEATHARINLNSSMTCPFLSRERLCGIQQEFGDEYLADICSSYPRVTRRIDGLIERSLLLSCPEAARLVLLNSNLTRPDPAVTGDRSPYYRFLLMGEQSARPNGSPHQYLWEIRGLSLLLLQDRGYPLWERLFLLGMFCKRLQEIISAQQNEVVPQLLKVYAEIIVQGKLRAGMDSLPAQSALQLAVVMEIVRSQLEITDVSHIRFRECVKDFLSGIHYDPGAPVESYAPSYTEAYTRYYQPFMQAHPFMLENYLTNHVFRTRFPFGVDTQGNPNDPQTEFLTMCLQYAVIKGLLIGMAGRYGEEFSAEHVVKVVQSFAKAAEHSPKFLDAINPDLANADGMALLLKN
jgi:lysine-N-methylase